MASASDGLCTNDPNFAVICNFLDRYGELLGIKDISYSDLQTWIEDTKHVSSFLSDIHIRLMRRMGKKITADKWEKYIMKFIHDTYSEVDAWEIDRYGYKQSKVSTKLTLLKTLLEKQFDLNKTFKEKINEKSPEELRYLPLGRDKNGLAYWYMLDTDLNLRVYREDLDDVNAETWELVCSNRQELASLIGQLGEGKTEDVKDSNSETSGSLKNGLNEEGVKNEVSEDSQDSVLSKESQTRLKMEADTEKNLSDSKPSVKKEPDKSGETRSDEVDGVDDKHKKTDSTPSTVKCEVKLEDIMKVEVKREPGDKSDQGYIPAERESGPSADVGSCESESVENSKGEKKPEDQRTKDDSIEKERSEKHSKSGEGSDVDEKGNTENRETSLKDTSSQAVEKSSIQSTPEILDKDKVAQTDSSKNSDTSDKVDTSCLTSSVKAEGKQLTFDRSELSTSDSVKDSTESANEKERQENEENKCNKAEVEGKSTSSKSDGEIEKALEKVDVDSSLINTTSDMSGKSEKESAVRKVGEETNTGDNKASNRKSPTSHHGEEIVESGVSTVLDTAQKEQSISESAEAGKERSEATNGLDKEEKRTEEKTATNGDKEKKDECEKEQRDSKSCDEVDLQTNECDSVNEEKKDKAEDENPHTEKTVVESVDIQKLEDSQCKAPKTVEEPQRNIPETAKESQSEMPETGKESHSKKSDTMEESQSKKTETDEESQNKKSDKVEESQSKETETVEGSLSKTTETVDESQSKKTEIVDEPLSKKTETVDESQSNKTVTVEESLSKKIETNASDKKVPTKMTNKNKNARKRGIQYDDTSEDSVVEPENKRAKDGKKLLPKGKRKTPSKVEALSSDDSDDIPLSQMSRGRTPNKSKSRKRVETDSSQSLVTPTRKSSRPSKKKKLHSDEEYEEEFLSIATPKSSTCKQRLVTSDEGSPAPEANKKVSKKSKKSVLNSKETFSNSKGKNSKKKQLYVESSDRDTPPKGKKSKKSKSVKEDSDDEPLMKSAKKAKKTKLIETSESEVDAGRRRSARVKTLKKQKKREKTPEYSSLEEDNAVESDFKLTSELESDDSDDVDYSPKGRNALRQAARIKQEEQEVVNNDTPCCKCLKYDRPEWLLLCDVCDAGYHTACLRPPLFVIPEGDWFCPPCEHKQLVSRLQENLKELDVLLKKHDRLIKRKERLAFVGISLDNILREERKENIEPEEFEEGFESQSESESSNNSDSSYDRRRRRRQKVNNQHHHKKPQNKDSFVFSKRTCRQRGTISYKFEDFDEMINSAIKEEVEEVKVHKAEYKRTNYGRNRGKDMANIYEAEGREYHPSEEEEDGKPPPVVNKKKKVRKLTLLDSDEEDEPQDDDSEEFRISEESCSEPPEEEEEDEEDDEEEISDFSEDGEGWRSCRRRSQYGRSTRRSARRKTGASRYKDFVVDDEYDSDDYRRSRRKATRKRVNYDEMLEDEDETELSEETEETLSSSDLCSDDSVTKSRLKKSSKKGKKKKKEKKKKKKVKRRIKSEEESENESDKENEEENNTDDDLKIETKKKAQKRDRGKGKKKKKKNRYSENDSDSESDFGKRRSRRFLQKVNYKALLGSDTENEASVKSKKKKKETSTESSASETSSESSVEDKPPTKKKGAILEESTDEEEMEKEETDKLTEMEDEEKQEDLKEKGDEVPVDEQTKAKVAESTGSDDATDEQAESIAQEESSNEKAEPMPSENSGQREGQNSDPLSKQEIPQGPAPHMSTGPQPIARPFPQYSDGHFPHQNFSQPGYPSMQRMPYGPPQMQQFHPQQHNYPPHSQHNFPQPGPQGGHPPHYPQHYPQMSNPQQSHIGNPSGMRSPPQVPSMPSTGHPMGSPPHHQDKISSPPHQMSSSHTLPVSSQGPPTVSSRPGPSLMRPPGMQSQSVMGQGQPLGNFPSQGPGNFQNYPQQMQRPPTSQQGPGPNMGPMRPNYPGMPPMMGQGLPPQGMMNRPGMPGPMSYHGTQGMGQQGPPDSLRQPVSMGPQMPSMGYPSPQEHMMNRNQMHPSPHISSQPSSSGPPSHGQYSGPLTSLGQMVPPGAHGQGMPPMSTVGSPSTMPTTVPSTSPSNGTSPKAAGKRGRPKGSKTKKRKGEPIDSPKSETDGIKEKVPVTGQMVQSQQQITSQPEMIGSFPRPPFQSPHPNQMRPEPMIRAPRPQMMQMDPGSGNMGPRPGTMGQAIRGPPHLIPDSQGPGSHIGGRMPHQGPRFETYSVNGGLPQGMTSSTQSSTVASAGAPIHASPGSGGGRGFMIDNLLEKPQKAISPEDQYTGSTEGNTPGEQSEDSQDNGQMERIEYSSMVYQEEGEGMSDIADIVKCFKA